MSTQAAKASAAAYATGVSGLLLIGLSLGYFMVLLDTTIVTVALPAISDGLHVGLSALQWVQNGYTVAFAALLLTGGWLADRYGGRRVFLIGLVAFGLFSALSAASASIGMLIALRALLGVAGALLLPASLAVITNAYTDPALRARAVGSWAAITGLALVAGPVVGGVLTDTVGWRAIFLVNVPITVASLVITVRLAPETARKVGRGLDLLGQTSVIVALAALIYGLVEGPSLGWSAPAVLTAFVVTVLAVAMFLIAEQRAGDEAMLPLRLFGNSTFSTALLAGLLVNFALSGVLFVMSLFFQESRGYSALAAGLVFLPLTLPTAVNPIFTGRLVGRIGPRVPATLGFTLMGVGALAQVLSTSNSTGALVINLIGLLVFGIGISFALPSLVATIVGAVPKELAGIGSGALNSARQLGASLGVAVLGVVLGTSDSVAAGTRWSLLLAGLILLAGAVIVVTFIGRKRLT